MSNNLDLIFKSYDIRGVFGDSLTSDDAYKIGYSFSQFVESDSILIGHDGRISNIEMLNAVVSGITSNGKSILYVGLVPTDVCLLYTSPSPRDRQKTRMPSSA